MSCYKGLAQIYDALINTDINYNAWSKVILQNCRSQNVEFLDYLDLACGTGNLTVEVSGAFKNTWAVDLSSEMLSEAEAKIRQRKLSAKFVCQDICELNLNRSFDLITCCLDSTNYILEENALEDYFKAVHKHLNANGVFVFDINSYYKLTEILGNNIFNYDNDEVVYTWENSLNEEIVDMFLTFFVKEGELYRRFDEEHSERAYKMEYIETVLEKIGFEIINKLDNYKDNNIRENAERIVYILKKKK
jgi:predicted TPR repeat methyltransferase